MEMIALREKNPAKFSGLVGQLGAVLTHYVSTARLQELKNSKVPVMIITGNFVFYYFNNSAKITDFKNSKIQIFF